MALYWWFNGNKEVFEVLFETYEGLSGWACSFLHMSDAYFCCSQTYMDRYVFGYSHNLNMLLVGFIILIGFLLYMNSIVILKV